LRKKSGKKFIKVAISDIIATSLIMSAFVTSSFGTTLGREKSSIIFGFLTNSFNNPLSSGPSITNINESPDPQKINGYVNISCNVADPDDVDEVYINITYPNNNIQNFSITGNKTGDIYYCNQTYELAGQYIYFIWANDTNGDATTSSIHSFSIVRWNVVLNVSESGGKYDTAVFGEVDDASYGKDNYDTPKPPAPGHPYIRSWFDAGLDPPYDELWADYRDYPNTFESWNLYIKTNTTPPLIGDTNITIIWDSDDVNSTEYDVVELWNDTVKLADMKTDNDFIFSADYDITYDFQIKCRMLYTPGAPTGFTATAVGTDQIDLSWTVGSNSDKTYVEWNSSPSWSLGVGTLLYNGSGTSTSHSGLDPHTTYYYQTWGWNETDELFSSGYASGSNITWNTPPVYGTPSPVNGSTGIDLSLTWSIPISDGDGDTFNWSIECSNGQSNSSAGVVDWNDSVDNNTSDKDSTADKGTESNFDNCKEIAPDTDVMTLFEADQASSPTEVNDSVDWNGATKDSVDNNGTESGFVNVLNDLNPDSDVMTLWEENQGIPAVDEYKYVATGTQDYVAWTETGNDPYINTVEGSSYIESSVSGQDEGWFTFDDTTNTGSGFTVTVECYATGDNNDDITVYCDYTGDKVSDATVTCANPTGSYSWIASGTVTGCDTATEINALQCWYEELKQGGQGTIRIDCSRIHITRNATSDYEFDWEYQFNGTDYNCTYEQLCFYLTGSVSENLLVYDWDGSSFGSSIGTITGIGWTNISCSDLTGGTYNIRLQDENQSSESTNHSWTIDVMKLMCWNDSIYDYELDVEYQFNDTEYNCTNEQVCLFLTGSVTENILVDYYNSGWINLGTISSAGWNNFTATGLSSSTYNIRIYDQNQTSETTQHSWTIDCMFLHCWNTPTTDYELYISGLDYDTLYTVWVNASDGFGGNVSEWFVFTTKIIPNVISLHTNWNLISFPVNESINKTDIVVSYAGTNYSWNDAVTNNIIIGFIYGWNRTTQSYETIDILDPGYGYWVYAYHDCNLSFSSNITDDGYITALKQKWNIIGLPYKTSVAKENLTIYYNGVNYTWQEAVNNYIILGFIYGWDRNTQSYIISDDLDPGYGYWMYAYFDCILKK